MKRSSTILLASMIAVAGVAQAQTFDSPMRAGEASTMTGGEPNALTTNSPYPDGTAVIDTRVLGAGPVVTYGTPSGPVVSYGTTTYYGPTYYSWSTPSGVVVAPAPVEHWNRSGRPYAAPGSYYGD